MIYVYEILVFYGLNWLSIETGSDTYLYNTK